MARDGSERRVVRGIVAAALACAPTIAAVRPTVIMKSAMTIDGQLAAGDGTSQWITGSAALMDAHRCRAAVDAVMVGAGTVIADNPTLNVRLHGYAGPQPVPVVVAGSRPLSGDAQVFRRDPIVLSARSVELPGTIVMAADESGTRVDLAHGLELLYGLGIRRVLVEGGSGLLTSLLRADLIDRGIVYYGQKLAGGVGTTLFTAEWATLSDARDLTISDVRRVGGDVRVEFEIDGVNAD